jgi:16S rRNA (uracil1498-N3)-methyltransferase
LQRYFVENNQIKNEKITIAGEDAHHIVRVMRMKVNDPIICVDPNGKLYQSEIEEISNETVYLRIVKWMDVTNELPVSVTIAQGLPKGDKLELVIQKGTELGANAFLPFFASRSIVKWDEKKGRKKVERLEKIAKEAAEQSHRNKLPQISEALSFDLLIQESSRYDLKIVAYEEAAKSGEISRLASSLRDIKEGQSIVAVFGPEGGLTNTEITKLENSGFISCGLGPRILRTETAPFYFLAAVSYQLELMR